MGEECGLALEGRRAMNRASLLGTCDASSSPGRSAGERMPLATISSADGRFERKRSSRPGTWGEPSPESSYSHCSRGEGDIYESKK